MKKWLTRGKGSLFTDRLPNIHHAHISRQDGVMYLGTATTHFYGCRLCGGWLSMIRGDMERAQTEVCPLHGSIERIKFDELDSFWLPLWKRMTNAMRYARGFIANRLAWLVAGLCVTVVIGVGFTKPPKTWSVQRPQQCMQNGYSWYRKDGERIICLEKFETGATRSE